MKNDINFDDCLAKIDMFKIGSHKTKTQKVINYIKNIFRSKEKKQTIMKFYIDNENYIEKFVTLNNVKIGKTKDGLGTFSFSGVFKK